MPHEYWPFLDTQGVSSPLELAALYIKRTEGKSLGAQLKELNVTDIHIYHRDFAAIRDCEASLGLNKEKTGWRVSLSGQVFDPIMHSLFFGHEIGHIFLFDPKTFEPLSGCEDSKPYLNTHQHRWIEFFAEAFGTLWRNCDANREMLTELLEVPWNKEIWNPEWMLVGNEQYIRLIDVRSLWPPSP